MGDVPVAAHDNFPTRGAQLAQMWQERSHEVEFHLLTLLAAGARWQIQRDHTVIGKIGTNIAPFYIKFGYPQTDNDLSRLGTAVNAHAAVALLFGVMEIAVIAVRGEHGFRHISRLRLKFL